MSELQHHDWMGDSLSHPPLLPGPVALEPFRSDLFVDAVASGGGALQPLDHTTKGLLWVSPSGAEELQAILDTHPGIDWIQLPWAGVDAFASVLEHIAAMPESQRPVVTSAKGAYSEPVAEHALALLLGCMRELPRKAREAHWQDENGDFPLRSQHCASWRWGRCSSIYRRRGAIPAAHHSGEARCGERPRCAADRVLRTPALGLG